MHLSRTFPSNQTAGNALNSIYSLLSSLSEIELLHCIVKSTGGYAGVYTVVGWNDNKSAIYMINQSNGGVESYSPLQMSSEAIQAQVKSSGSTLYEFYMNSNGGRSVQNASNYIWNTTTVYYSKYS